MEFTILSNDLPHKSDCSVHNEPAYTKGQCDCVHNVIDQIGEELHEFLMDNLSDDGTSIVTARAAEQIYETVIKPEYERQRQHTLRQVAEWLDQFCERHKATGYSGGNNRLRRECPKCMAELRKAAGMDKPTSEGK